MTASDEQGAIGADDLRALVPPLVTNLHRDHALGDGPFHVEVDASLLSADISGFTRLSEELAELGRRGAEMITDIVNGCFRDLIAAAESYGGDVIKFGGDAVLILFLGVGHERRAALAGQAMQLALGNNRHARQHDLSMTVGAAAGPFHVLVTGSGQRDLLVTGPTTSTTLRLEAAAGQGEVAVDDRIVAAFAAVPDEARADGTALFGSALFAPPSTHANESAELLRGFVPHALQAHYLGYAELGAEHRRAAIAFVMIGGVDGHLADAGGPETAAALGHVLDHVTRSLEPVEATLLHSDAADDGLKLVLGAGVPHSAGNPADALLQAALDIVTVESPLTIRVGLQIGAVFAGFLGPPHRRTFTVMGDTVNTAARMLGLAGDRDVVAVMDVVRGARGGVEGEHLDPVMVKGKQEPIHAMKIRNVVAGESERESPVPLVGRDEEAGILREAVNRGGAMEVVGAAGSGKTRLRQEAVFGDGTVAGSCGPYTTASPYAPFWGALREAFDIPMHAAPSTAGEAVAQFMADLAPEQATLAPPGCARVRRRACAHRPEHHG